MADWLTCNDQFWIQLQFNYNFCFIYNLITKLYVFEDTQRVEGEDILVERERRYRVSQKRPFLNNLLSDNEEGKIM